jgi:hypothetical protein
LKLPWYSAENNFWRCALVFEKIFFTDNASEKRERSHDNPGSKGGDHIEMGDKQGVKVWTGLNWISSAIMGCYAYGNCTLESIKGDQCLNPLRDGQSVSQEEFYRIEFVVK